MPVTRKRKIEVARLAGFGLVLAGLFALFLAVTSAQTAGAEKRSPRTASLHCQRETDNSLGQAVQSGACQTTTSIDTEGSTTTYLTTTTKKHCGCNTTTTTADTLPASSTTTEVTTTTTEESTTTTGETTSTTTAGSLPVESSTTTETTPETETSVTAAGVTVSTIAGSPIGGGGDTTPVSEADAVSGQLPFTGSSGLPLAGIGVLLVATGLALAVRSRRFAR